MGSAALSFWGSIARLVRIPTRLLPYLLTRTRWDPRTIKVLARSVDYGPVMPNLYFCQPHAQNQGMLRAVISLADCKRLIGSGDAEYVGEQFPTVFGAGDHTKDFAVVGFSPTEAQGEWKAGYYCFEADLMELNAQLLTLAR
jgi:hypothetical protein